MRDLGLPPGIAGSEAFVAAFCGNRIPPGADPLAAVYAGHQFGVYVPRLGDGRAILLGGVRAADGSVQELQLKGSGLTPYSRMADGRAVLRSSIREFLASEAMHALGVPTTRALSVIGSPAPVMRESVETAAVVTRVAPSFVRFGSFEYFYWQQQHPMLRALADHVIDGFYPECRDADQPYLELLAQVGRRTAKMVARWQALGFCHGVMNTDNLSILGLTLDYGPFGFIDRFDAGHICNHSDDAGRYAFNQQPSIAHWNLRCLGQAMLPLTGDVDRTLQAVDAYWSEFEQAMLGEFAAKLGLTAPRPEDASLIDVTLDLLHRHQVDWTTFWRRLSEVQAGPDTGLSIAPLQGLGVPDDALQGWMQRYRDRLLLQATSDGERRCSMRRTNPKFVLRNHLAERAIAAARGDHGEADFSEVRRLLQCLQHPYDEQPHLESYALPPDPGALSVCVSCSS
jgi:uncharacterized protein YdiU (UPF0061 family)